MSTKLTQLVGVLGIGSAFTALVDAEAGPHTNVTRFGEAWNVRSSTGQASVVHSVEALLEAVALPATPCEPADREAARNCLELLLAGPLAEPAVHPSAAELLTALRVERSESPVSLP
ncbi:hypothetical protein G7066_02260 [Leucobacter coleopterorum]|uniref:Uncharacterized protein n=1 Tax=Leucobacter coleopterorum TaxID=2714933 RepID=A0ABX6JU56_9MICO|nr:hypothetical protein [Leucobacter coleopterorum]QIM17807.1 hypothetical protein G7066_02260 [Leucobacter coleopterorum]